MVQQLPAGLHPHQILLVKDGEGPDSALIGRDIVFAKWMKTEIVVVTVVGLNELRPKIRAWQASSVTTRKPSHPTFKYPMFATLPDRFIGQQVVYVSGESMLEKDKAAMKNKAWDDRGDRDNRVEHDLLTLRAEMTNLALAEYFAEQKLPKLKALGNIPP